MYRPDIVIDEKPEPAVRDAIVAPLQAYNQSQVGPLKPQLLAIRLQNPQDDTIVGGLWGRSVAGWLFVDLLVVPDGLRRQGIGTSLMEMAEDVARKRGCVGIWLYTSTFQAPAFYEKLGYSRFGQLPNYPAGHENIYYSKHLDDSAGC